MSWQDLPASRSLCFQQNLLTSGCWVARIPEEGPLKSGTLALPVTPLPPCASQLCVPDQRVVVVDNFSSSLGLAGPAHCWGGAAAVEGNSASDPSLEQCLPLLVAEPRGGRRDLEARWQVLLAPSQEETGSGPESRSSHPASTRCPVLCQVGGCSCKKSRQNSLPSWTYHLMGVRVVSQVRHRVVTPKHAAYSWFLLWCFSPATSCALWLPRETLLIQPSEKSPWAS